MAHGDDRPARPAPAADAPRVPYALRGAVDAACRLPPVRACGRGAYAIVARHCARRLAAFPGAQAVYLRGRDVRASDPGVSDLDFWLRCTDAALHDPASLVELRRRFQALRRATLLPGKLELTSERAWGHAVAIAPADLAEDLPLRRLTAAGWEPLPDAPARPARPASRVGLASRNLALALAHLARSRAGRDGRYDAVVAARYLGKAHAAATGAGDPRTTRQATPAALAETLLALDALAGAALAAAPPPVDASLAIRPSAGGATLRRPPALDRLVARLARDGVPATAALPPGVLLWQPDAPDPATAERLFASLLARPAELIGETPIAPATLSTYRCLWRGPRLGPLLERLPSIPDECSVPPGGEAAFAAEAYVHRLETLAIRVNHAPGVLVSYPPATFATALLCQCAELLVVASRHVTNDLDLLCELGRERLPATVGWARRLRLGTPPADVAGWAEGFAQVRAEALDALDRLDAAGRGAS